MQGIKEKTNDIDIAVSDDLYRKLLKQYSCNFERKANDYDVWFIDGIINFSKNYYNDIDIIEHNGYKIQSLDSVLQLKNTLHREKDNEDIKIIMNYINKEY